MDGLIHAKLIERIEELHALDTELLGMTLSQMIAALVLPHVEGPHVSLLEYFQKRGLDLATRYKEGSLDADGVADALVSIVQTYAKDYRVDWSKLDEYVPEAPSVEDVREAYTGVTLAPLSAFTWVRQAFWGTVDAVGEHAVERIQEKIANDERVQQVILMGKIGLGISVTGLLYTVLKE